MDRYNRPPALHLDNTNEKPLPSLSSSQPFTPYRSASSSRPSSSRPHTPLPLISTHRTHHPRQLHHSPCAPRGPRLLRVMKPWLPMILYAITSLAFVVAFALYRTELFAFLDELSLWLRADESYGHAVLFFLIFLTTIPPIPLYSTLIVLSGYTFGPWAGAILSYFAALAGALVVFIVSRSLFSESIGTWLNSYTSIKRVVRAIEKRPKLLFLIRLAPYPYNVMNCLLAASPTLTLHTYTVCTALSLFKVIIHTSLGASIHSFRDYHSVEPDSTDDESNADWVARVWTFVGIVMCVLIFVYLSIVARRAVDEELDDEPISSRDCEERVAFLSAPSDVETGLMVPGDETSEEEMVESPFRSHHLVSSPMRATFTLPS